MYYVYIIRDKFKKEIYIGFTENIKRRMKEHKYRNPELIYLEGYKDKLDAMERERKLKQRGQAIRRIKERIKRSLSK